METYMNESVYVVITDSVPGPPNSISVYFRSCLA